MLTEGIPSNVQFEQFFKVFRTLHNTRPGSEKNLLLPLYQFWFNTVTVNTVMIKLTS